VNDCQALELEGALSRRYPGGEVTVTPQDDGARIVIKTEGESCVLSVGDVPSVLLGYLLTGHADRPTPAR
jgi:hypothetical protein